MTQRAAGVVSELMRHLAPLLACVLLPSALLALPFDGSWREQRFSLFSSNDYTQRGAALEIVSDGAVSLLWRAVPADARGARQATWRWQVDQSVPATDLARKGGDDRNVSLYFVFLPSDLVAEAEGRPIRWLLKRPEVRVLLYVWGGKGARGRLVPSPYLLGQGTSVVLRDAGTGVFEETVDLAGDYRRAFGDEAGALVGLAVSSDGDDTGSVVRATLSDLELR